MQYHILSRKVLINCKFHLLNSHKTKLTFEILIFSCVADNALGRTKKYIEISGRPGPAEFISPTFSGSLEYYNLTWSVESIPPLDEGFYTNLIYVHSDYTVTLYQTFLFEYSAAVVQAIDGKC